jgi:hypothetical protein
LGVRLFKNANGHVGGAYILYLNNWLGRLLKEKLHGKCTEVELFDIAASIMQKQLQEDVLTFITKKESIVCMYEVRDLYAVEELKKGKSFSFVVKGSKFEDCYLPNKNIDVFSVINKFSDEFTQVDSRTLVKLAKVNRYNSDKGHLYFDNPEEDKAPIWMQVNMSSMSLIKRKVGIEKDICAPKPSAYAYRGGWKLGKDST